MAVGLFLAFCSKYSVGLASSEPNSSAAGAAPEVAWLPAAEAGGYWCAALLVLLLVTCAGRRRRRAGDGSAGCRQGLCGRLASCWPWAPHVTESPLASQIHLGRASIVYARQDLRYEQLVENCYVHTRAVLQARLSEGRGEEITEQARLAVRDDQKPAKAGGGGAEELASGEPEETLERVWAAQVKGSTRLQQTTSEPLPVREPEDRLLILEDTIFPIAIKADGSSPSDRSERESPPPNGSAEDKQMAVYASKQRAVAFSDKLRYFLPKLKDEAGSSTRADSGGKEGDRTQSCPLHSVGGPLSARPSAKSLASIRDGDVLDQEVEYNDKLCTCPPSQKESPRLVGVSSSTSHRPTENEQQRQQVEVVRLLSRFSSFVEDEKDAVPKDPLTIPQSWVPIQEQASFARSTTPVDGTRLAENLSEIASRESGTTPERRRRSVEQVTSRRGIKRIRNQRDDGYVTPVLHRKTQTKPRAYILDSSHRRRKSRSVAAQTSPSSSPPAPRILFTEIGTQAQFPQVRSVVMDRVSTALFGTSHGQTQTERTQEVQPENVLSKEVVTGDSRVPSSCFLHEIVPSLHTDQQKRKRPLISFHSEENAMIAAQYTGEPKYTIAPAAVSVANEALFGSSNVNTARRHAEHRDQNFAGEVESGLSTQWDLLHNFPSSSISSRAGEDKSVVYVTRNPSAFEEGADVIRETRPHSVCSTVTEQMLHKVARSKLRAPAEASQKSVELLYNRKGKRVFSESSPGTPTSEPEEFTVYLQCADAVCDYEQNKSFEAEERLLYGPQPEREYSKTERSAGRWRATPDYLPASPTVMETPASHPVAQQRPNAAAPSLTGDQQTMLHWKIIVHPQKGAENEGSTLVPERGLSHKGKQDNQAASHKK